MSAASITHTGKATEGSDQLAGRERPFGRQIPRAMQILRGLFPRGKPAHEIAGRTRHGIRAAERWLAGTREMGAEAFLALLLSDVGPDLLAKLADGLPKAQRAIFWARVERIAKAKVKQHRIDKLAEEIEQLTLPVGPSDLRRHYR